MLLRLPDFGDMLQLNCSGYIPASIHSHFVTASAQTVSFKSLVATVVALSKTITPF